MNNPNHSGLTCAYNPEAQALAVMHAQRQGRLYSNERLVDKIMYKEEAGHGWWLIYHSNPSNHVVFLESDCNPDIIEELHPGDTINIVISESRTYGRISYEDGFDTIIAYVTDSKGRVIYKSERYDPDYEPDSLESTIEKIF